MNLNRSVSSIEGYFWLVMLTVLIAMIALS
jgi:hypothetical protein